MIVKVCGMREPENIREVENAGADWIGFICYQHSLRFVPDIPAYLPHRCKRIGVFVNEDTERIIARAQELQLDYLQLHGNESPDTCRTLHRQGFRIIKALAPKAVSDFSLTTAYAPYCDYLLFDTPCTGFGGSGEKFDWTLLKHYKGETPFLLSGGICPESLNDLLAFRHPRWAGIDLNSGFETAPGIKDAEKLKTFIERINNVSMNNVLMRE